MSCSKERYTQKYKEYYDNDESFAFLSFIWLEEWENVTGERCICSMHEDDLVVLAGLAKDRHPGEAAVEIGFDKMGVSVAKRRALIDQWTHELGKNVGKWLSEKHWHTYIYYKFMAWRIVQVKHSKQSEEMREQFAQL